MQTDRTLAPLPEELRAHYLAILGVAPRKPSLEALRELLAAHLTRIPFENISKLYYRKRLGLVNLPPIRLYLDGIDKYHFGGTCYSITTISICCSAAWDTKRNYALQT